MKGGINTRSSIREELGFLEKKCDELMRRVTANKEHVGRIGEIRNIQTIIRAALEIPFDADQVFDIFRQSKKRLEMLDADPTFLGSQEFLRNQIQTC